MIKYILLLLLTTTIANATVYKKYKVSLPVKKQQQTGLTKEDLLIIYGATELIIKLEGFTSVFILDFDGKTPIIGHGDRICSLRYSANDKITKKQAKNCVIETVFDIYVKLKKELPNLTGRQYVALIDLIYNVKFNKNKYKNGFYSTNLFKLLKCSPKNKYRIIYEWQDCSKVNGKFVKSILNRRNKELEIFYN